MSEMITIISFTHFCANFIIRQTLRIGKFMQFSFKILMQLAITDSADFYILLTHRNILQIIQIAEYTYLSEFRNSRKHTKFNAAILAF